MTLICVRDRRLLSFSVILLWAFLFQAFRWFGRHSINDKWIVNIRLLIATKTLFYDDFYSSMTNYFYPEKMCWTFDKKETKSIFKQKVWKIIENYRVPSQWFTAESSIEIPPKKLPSSNSCKLISPLFFRKRIGTLKSIKRR